ncbi:rhodanese-like domain-containing protein [Undibacterium squillarum]|nr:rhodanese-like domain-containing protein [Undibacterium squillarum]
MSAQEILSHASARATEQQLPYAGAVTPEEAWNLLQQDPSVILIDVRTQAERDWIGKVSVPEQQHGAVQWSLYPGGTPNPAFLSQLKETVPDKQRCIVFLCRSGVRSRHAAKAATEAGYTQCFDILEGFEGDKDTAGHRKTVGGWCFRQLPWTGA